MISTPCPHTRLRLNSLGCAMCTKCGAAFSKGALAARYESALGLIASLSRDEDEAVYLAATRALVEVSA